MKKGRFGQQTLIGRAFFMFSEHGHAEAHEGALTPEAR